MENENVGIQRRTNFTIITDHIIDDERVKQTDLLTFLSISRFADKTGTCFPGISKICTKARLSRNAVIQAIKHLEELGYLVKVKRYDPEKKVNFSNVYLIVDNPGGVVHQEYYPSAPGVLGVVHQVDPKEEVLEGNIKKEEEEDVDRLPALSVYTDIEELYTDRPLPFTETEKEAYLDRLTKYGKEAVRETYRPWFESKIKSRGQCPKREWWVEVPIIKKQEAVRKDHAAPICEHCGKPMLSGICQNKDCPQYIGLENIHLHLQKQGFDDTSPAARMVESLVGAAV